MADPSLGGAPPLFVNKFELRILALAPGAAADAAAAATATPPPATTTTNTAATTTTASPSREGVGNDDHVGIGGASGSTGGQGQEQNDAAKQRIGSVTEEGGKDEKENGKEGAKEEEKDGGGMGEDGDVERRRHQSSEMANAEGGEQTNNHGNQHLMMKNDSNNSKNNNSSSSSSKGGTTDNIETNARTAKVDDEDAETWDEGVFGANGIPVESEGAAEGIMPTGDSLLSAATVESHPLDADENGLCVCLVTLEHAGFPRMYVAVGTGINESQGEDKAVRMSYVC